jgi:hypothetical protein
MLPTLAILNVMTSLLLPCPPVGELPHAGYENAWRIWAAGPATSPGGLPAGYEPAIHGQWQAPDVWPVTAIHALVLPDGNVLHYAYPQGGNGSNARVWNPTTGVFQDVSLDTDVFCSGHSVLPDGRVLVMGGNDYNCQFQGRTDTYIFDPGDQSWTFIQDMNDARWYPTPTALGDGRVIITSGLALDCQINEEMEIYVPGGGVELVPEGHRSLQLYPRIHLLSDGRIVHVGPEQNTYQFQLGGTWQFLATQNFGGRWNGSSLMIPGTIDEVMIIGGGSTPNVTNTVEVIDFKDANPQWAYAAPMIHARGHHDALILPDKTIFVMGGGLTDLYGDPVYNPELYDPVTETWRQLPPHVYGRMYHSTTLLLPDGRVVTAGQDNGESYFWGEIYEPPYLFRGARPVIDQAPSSLVYGQQFTIDTAQAARINQVALIRLSSNTHSVNFEQRYVDLEHVFKGESQGGQTPHLSVQMETNPNIAPPGHYMLFILNGNDVPSVATMVQVDHPIAADLDFDGAVTVADLLLMLGVWGPCDGCAADLNGDGVINVRDLLLLLAAWS